MWNTYSGIQLEGSDLIQILYQKLEPGTCSHSNTTCAALHPLYRTTRVPYHASALPGRGGRGRGRGSHLSLLVGLVWVWSGFGLGLFNLLDGLDGGVGGRGTALLYHPCATFTPLFAALHPQDGISSGIRLYSRVSTPGPQILYNTVFSWLPLCIPHVGSGAALARAGRAIER